jgi:hypothetical protein
MNVRYNPSQHHDLHLISGYFAICVGGLFSGHARRPPDVVV